jgi:hypothetical protein
MEANTDPEHVRYEGLKVSINIKKDSLEDGIPERWGEQGRIQGLTAQIMSNPWRLTSLFRKKRKSSLHHSGPKFKPQFHQKKRNYLLGCWWLMPVILATQKAEIRRMVIVI